MLYDEYRMAITKERLIDLRKEKKLSLEQLSRELEKRGVIISHTNLMYYEIGDPYHKLYNRTRSMSIEILAALADFYGVTLDYLMGFTTSRTIEYQSISDLIKLGDDAIDNILRLQEDDEYIEFSYHGKAMTVLNAMFRDKRVLLAIRDMANSEIAHRNNLFTSTDTFRERCENDEELQAAIKKVEKSYMMVVEDKYIEEFLACRAINYISEFIREYPETGYKASLTRMAHEGEI